MPLRQTIRIFTKIGIPVHALPVVGLLMSTIEIQQILDTRLFYSSNEAIQYFAQMTMLHSKLYLHHELLDLVYLCVYSILFFNLFEILFPLNKKLLFLAFLPGVFDLLETSSILYVLRGGSVSRVSAWLGTSTLLKWITGTALLLTYIGRIIFLMKQALHRKKSFI